MEIEIKKPLQDEEMEQVSGGGIFSDLYEDKCVVCGKIVGRKMTEMVSCYCEDCIAIAKGKKEKGRTYQ